MHSYIETALINAAMVVPLAFVAEVTGRVLRRPALTHLLWVLVLVKLVTPPIVQIPLIDREWLSYRIQQVTVTVAKDADRPNSNRATLQATTDRSVNSGLSPKPKTRPRPRTLAEQDKRAVAPPPTTAMVFAQWLRNGSVQQLAITGLLLAWGLGALVWFSIQGFRCVRFRLSLAEGQAAEEGLQQFADDLARRLGLPRSPTVWLMPGVMSPMLWGSGESSLLIFPQMLLDRLEPEAAGTLLTHELAHYRRRDHFVRIVALMATGFFWWHPVVWWARRQIEAVEEECCDALVLKAAAAPPKRYAEAILDTVDFLAEFRLTLPALATGLGQLPFLRQRLTWIMRGPRRQDLGHLGKVLILVLGSSLPWQPTWIAARTQQIPLTVPVSPGIPQRIIVPQSVSPVPYDPEISIPAEMTSVQNPVPQEEPKLSSRWTGFSVRAQSFDGRFVVMGNKLVQFLLDLESGREFELTEFAITAMAFTPNSYQFASVGTDRTLRLWNAATCEVTQTWQVPGGSSKSVDVSVDAQWIATGGRDGIIRIWSESNSTPVFELPREFSPVNCLRFSPDGQLLAAATGDWMSPQSGRIVLFDAGRWTERISMNWNSPAAVVAFRGDGESLASGDWQGRIARWSIETGELLGLTQGQKDLVAAAEYSPSIVLAEIEIPDFQPDESWGDPNPSGSVPWFFNTLKLAVPATPTQPQMGGSAVP